MELENVFGDVGTMGSDCSTGSCSTIKCGSGIPKTQRICYGYPGDPKVYYYCDCY